MSKSYISSITEEWVFKLFSDMPNEEFTKYLQVLYSARRIYFDSDLVESFVFEYLDSVYEIMCDVLVCKALG